METFYIEKNSQNATHEGIQAQIREPHHRGNEKIHSPECNTKNHVRCDSNPTVFEGIPNTVKKIVKNAACNAAQHADKKNINLVCVRHLNSL